MSTKNLNTLILKQKEYKNKFQINYLIKTLNLFTRFIRVDQNQIPTRMYNRAMMQLDRLSQDVRIRKFKNSHNVAIWKYHISIKRYFKNVFLGDTSLRRRYTPGFSVYRRPQIEFSY